MRMFNPPHPGEILSELYLQPLHLSVTVAARRLGVSRKALSELIHGHTAMSKDMALRLTKAFPQTDTLFWLGLQTQHDAWQADKNASQIKIKPFAAQMEA